MIAGWFDGSVDLGFGPIFATSMRDTFVAALDMGVSAERLRWA